MPKVPELNHKALRIIFNPKDANAPASMKQKNYIITLCERRKLIVPDLKSMTMGEAAALISNMTNWRHD